MFRNFSQYFFHKRIHPMMMRKFIYTRSINTKRNPDFDNFYIRTGILMGGIHYSGFVYIIATDPNFNNNLSGSIVGIVMSGFLSLIIRIIWPIITSAELIWWVYTLKK